MPSSRRPSARRPRRSWSRPTGTTCSTSSARGRGPGGTAARDDQEHGVLELVPGAEVHRQHHPRSVHHGQHAHQLDGGRRVLDALVAEARLRWGLDPAQGLQVVAAERLVATPIEPSRPVLIVPLAAFRVDGARLPCRPCRAGRVRAAATRWRSSGGCIRPVTWSAGSGRPRGRRSGRSMPATSSGPCILVRWRPRARPRPRGRCPGSRGPAPARWLPLGP